MKHVSPSFVKWVSWYFPKRCAHAAFFIIVINVVMKRFVIIGNGKSKTFHLTCFSTTTRTRTRTHTHIHVHAHEHAHTHAHVSVHTNIYYQTEVEHANLTVINGDVF